MTAVDTTILERFYCDDPEDIEAKRQRPVARRLMVESASLFVPLTVLLEFEWVMRGFYRASTEEFCQATEHLPGMAPVTVERWEAVADAINLHRRGLDFVDALHWAGSSACSELVTFDDKGFMRRAQRLDLSPAVVLAA